MGQNPRQGGGRTGLAAPRLAELLREWCAASRTGGCGGYPCALLAPAARRLAPPPPPPPPPTPTGVRLGQLALGRGTSARHKVLLVEGMSPGAVFAKLRASVAKAPPVREPRRSRGN